METQIIVGVTAGIISYWAIKYFILKKKTTKSPYADELDAILSSKDFKVKGRFD